MKIYFDTSAINEITSDPQKSKVVDRLTSDHTPLLSALTISELVATTKQERRQKLLLVASNLTKIADPPYHRTLVDREEMLVRALKQFLDPSITIDFYSHQSDPFPELPLLRNPYAEIGDGKNLMSAGMKWLESAHRTRMDNVRGSTQTSSNQFPAEDVQLMQEKRADFLRGFIEREDLLKTYVNRLVVDIQLIKDIRFEDRLNGREIEILEKSDVWRLYLADAIIELYNRNFQRENYGHKNNPGWVDARQSVYVAEADVFVTNDRNQRKFMRIVSRFSLRQKRIWSYERLKAKLSL
jgi:hypothetical protein